jgi:hypothetical protein
VFLQQLSDNLVLALNLLSQSGYGLHLVFLGCRPNLLKEGSSTLEELLLPVLEHRPLNMVLVAKIGHGAPFEQMPAQDGNLFDRCVMLAWLSHGEPPIRV